MLHDGKKIRAVGGGVHVRPANDTFSEFLRDLVQWTFGEEWHKDQVGMKAENRHVVFKWRESFSQQTHEPPKTTIETPTGVQHTCIPYGHTSALMLLGWDLLCLRQAGALPKFIVEKMRDHSWFQSHRYMVAVGGILARAGFGVTFTDDTAGDAPRTDIIARESRSARVISVEAKSRRRAGVLHAKEGGTTSDSKWIRKMLDEAEGQNPGAHPLVVFLDLNSPDEADQAEIQSGIQREKRILAREYCAAIVTNFAHHYGAPKERTPGSWSIFYSPPKVRERERPPGPEVFDPIMEGIRDYGQDIPEEI